MIQSDRVLFSGSRYKPYFTFWKSQLLNYEDFSFRQSHESSSSSLTTCDGELEIIIAPEHAAQIKSMVKGNDMGIFVCFTTFVAVLLRKYSGIERMILDSPLIEKPQQDKFHTSRVPLLIEMQHTFTLRTALNNVKESVKQCYLYQNFPLHLLDEVNGVDVFTSNVQISYDKIHGLADSDAGYDLDFKIKDAEEGFVVLAKFNKRCYEPYFIKNLPVHFNNIVKNCLSLDTQIGSIDLLSNIELSMWEKFNTTSYPLPEATSVCHLFEEQVGLYSDRIAITDDSQQLTFRELNVKATRLANSINLPPGAIVAIIAQPSIEAVIAILGILKAGGTYLPIDPDYPKDRQEYMMKDSGASMLITHSDVLRDNEQITGLFAKENIFLLDALDQFSECNSSNTVRQIPEESNCYIIYTSGSTGNPKGVPISHKGLVNYCCWAAGEYGKGEKDLVFALFTSLAFDLTITSLFLPLITGNAIRVYRNTEDEMAIERLIKDDSVSIVKLTPSHLSIVRRMGVKTSHIKRLILGGENLERSLVKGIAEYFTPQLEVFNEYGPTETVVGCMIYKYHAGLRSSSVPIGIPAGNVQIYVLDADMKRVPLGVPGEMFISSLGISDGYLKQSDLTNKKFLLNPFHPGSTFFKTGDRARMLEDGNLEFLGRLDSQVKISGYRIELQEIEQQLLRHPDIQESVVLIRQKDKSVPVQDLFYCTKCGIASNYPGISFDQSGVCTMCNVYESYKHKADVYFKSMPDLRNIFERQKAFKKNEYDCLVLLSGGKDSTYVLYQLVLELGLKVFAFTLDNGFISDEAKSNIRRVVADLNVDHVFGATPKMNEIFVDSLQRHSNVCNGCFKTIYTLSVKVALEKNIKYIVTGLSRGQMFETRLNELYSEEVFDVNTIEKAILEARKVYHRMDDIVSQKLDAGFFASDKVFDKVQFIDFYRYCNVELKDMLQFLDQHAPWIRPVDTGRSTNCLINDLGIYIHKKERGFHNYSLPYSWDVRMGHKNRQEALEELDDELDEGRMHDMLRRIGFEKPIDTNDSSKLVAFVVAKRPLNQVELQNHLATSLPFYMTPSEFFFLPKLPLTVNGKLDVKLLQSTKQSKNTVYVKPSNSIEEHLVGAFEHVLKKQSLGVKDNFFELGGDSINATQIRYQLLKRKYNLSVKDIFSHPVIDDLAKYVNPVSRQLDQSVVVGGVKLGVSQHRFFSLTSVDTHHNNQAVLLSAPCFDETALRSVFLKIQEHHDVLRMTFHHENSLIVQRNNGLDFPLSLDVIDLKEQSDWRQAMEKHVAAVQGGIVLESGPLMRLALFRLPQGERLLIVIHHLVIDGVSWRILFDDIETLFQQHNNKEVLSLPLKTTSFKAAMDSMYAHAESIPLLNELVYWEKLPHRVEPIPADYMSPNNLIRDRVQNSFRLSQHHTKLLLTDVHQVFTTTISDLILTALGAAVKKVFSISLLLVDMEAHGREEIDTKIDLSRTVGWFTSVYPVALDCVGADLVQHIKSTKETMRKVPNNGIGYGLLKFLANKLSEQGTSARAQISFNYLGQFDADIADKFFTIASESTGNSQSPDLEWPYVFDISGIIINGELELSIGYNRNHYKTETIEQFRLAFEEELKNIIHVCISHREIELTPSDLGYSDLTMDELARIDTFFAG